MFIIIIRRIIATKRVVFLPNGFLRTRRHVYCTHKTKFTEIALENIRILLAEQINTLAILEAHPSITAERLRLVFLVIAQTEHLVLMELISVVEGDQKFGDSVVHIILNDLFRFCGDGRRQGRAYLVQSQGCHRRPLFIRGVECFCHRQRHILGILSSFT